MIQTLLTAKAATGGGSTVSSKKNQYAIGGVFAVDGITNATVKLQGRINANTPWLDLATLTADGKAVVQTFPQMRANVTAYVSGTINAYLLE